MRGVRAGHGCSAGEEATIGPASDEAHGLRAVAESAPIRIGTSVVGVHDSGGERRSDPNLEHAAFGRSGDLERQVRRV
jgi:hypothetical protein